MSIIEYNNVDTKANKMFDDIQGQVYTQNEINYNYNEIETNVREQNVQQYDNLEV